jgi:hypothetical protein
MIENKFEIHNFLASFRCNNPDAELYKNSSQSSGISPLNLEKATCDPTIFMIWFKPWMGFRCSNFSVFSTQQEEEMGDKSPKGKEKKKDKKKDKKG